MPQPLNPPYAPGALTSPRQLNRWLDVNVVSPLTRTRGYFELPAFTASQAKGTGYANIIAVWNFVAERNLSIRSISGSASGYVLCIMWVDQYGNVNRYSLWPNTNQSFFFDILPYTNQQIKKNFRLEVWNGDYVIQYYQNYLATEDNIPLGTENGDFLVTEQQAYTPQDSAGVIITQSTAIRFYTSLLGDLDYMYGDDFVIGTRSAQISDFYFDLTNPLTPPVNSTPTPNII